jgi:hypothetical protein
MMVERIDLESSCGTESLKSLGDTSLHGDLTGANPHTGIILLLVGLVSTLGVADLSLEIFNVLVDVVTDADQISPLQISIEVDLDDTMRDSLLELGITRARAAVEDKGDW